MRSATRFLRLLTLLTLAGCSIGFGGRVETCGEYPEGGGPAVIVTRDQEICEVVRLRVLRQLDAAKDLTRSKIDALLDRCDAWERRATMEKLLADVRKDAGDEIADEIKRAVDSVVATSTRSMRADCDDVEKCLVKGAVRGLRFALFSAQPSPTPPHAKEEEAPRKTWPEKT